MKLLLLALMLVSQMSFAGEKGGNGGDGILCKKDGTSTVQFYDIFEAEKVHGMKMNFPSRDLPEKERVLALLGRIQKFNPTRATLYTGWLETFYEDVKFTDNELIDVPDTSDGEIPRGCELKQIIIQREPKFPNEKRYTIAKMHWDLMDADSKVAAIMHELILRDLNQENSINVRYLNGKILEGEIKNLREYLELAKILDMETAEAHGFPVLVETVSFIDDNTVYFALVPNNRSRFGQAITYRDGLINFNQDSPINFNEDGKPFLLKPFNVLKQVNLPTSVGKVWLTKTGSTPLYLGLYPSGVPSSASMGCFEYPTIRRTTSNWICSRDLIFHPNGNLRAFGQIVDDQSGDIQVLVNGHWFNEFPKEITEDGTPIIKSVRLQCGKAWSTDLGGPKGYPIVTVDYMPNYGKRSLTVQFSKKLVVSSQDLERGSEPGLSGNSDRGTKLNFAESGYMKYTLREQIGNKFYHYDLECRK